MTSHDLSDSRVALSYSDQARYPLNPPYHPPEMYPEYPFKDHLSIEPTNHVYHAVRQSFVMLDLDVTRVDTPGWNPLGTVISPGHTVVVKPNAVWDINLKSGETVFASITHGSVLRAVVDYAYLALKGKGRLIIADCPLAHSDFENWKQITGVGEIVSFYRDVAGFEIEVYDLRQLYAPWDFKKVFAPSHLRQRASRDPLGYLEVDLGASSEFAGLSDEACRLIYGSDYNREHTVQHHIGGHHRYCIAKTFIDADVIISIPKLKVHSKVGVTLNLKGIVGTQGDKNYIPHYRIGTPDRGGDEHPDLGWFQNLVNRYRMWLLTSILSRETRSADLAYKLLYRFQIAGQQVADMVGHFRKGEGYLGNIIGGAWYGNDTAWRMTLDLNRIVLYADRDGKLQATPQRRFFSVIDGIIGGEAEGPLSPTARSCGVILSGFNPLAVDTVAARLMGFDPMKIMMLREGLRRPWLKMWTGEQDGISVVSNNPSFAEVMSRAGRFINFVAPRGWRGNIELGEPGSR